MHELPEVEDFPYIVLLRYTIYSTTSSEIFLNFELVLNFLIFSFLSQTPIHTSPLVPDDCRLAALDTLQKSLFSIQTILSLPELGFILF